MSHCPRPQPGGFTGDTELVTAEGVGQIAALEPGTPVYTLDLSTGRTALTPVRAVECHPTADLVAVETRRADLRLHPDQRIPFTTRAIATPRVVRAGDVAGRAAYTFLNEWDLPARARPSEVDITDWLDDYEICATTDAHGHTFRAALPDGCTPCRRNSHTGYYFDAETFSRYQSAIEAAANTVTIHAGPNHHRRPYRFDANDFIRFLGWYVTEGSVHWPETSHTAQVQIAQETTAHRQALTALFDRMGIDVHRDARRFEFGSVLFGRLLEHLCGSDSQSKHLPSFIWDCAPAQQRLLLDVLLKGDGNARGTYYTASPRLAQDLLRLCVVCGAKPRYTRTGDIWRVYVRDVADGFRPAEHVCCVHPTQDVYRLALAEGTTVLAGRNGTFQWLGGCRDT